MRAGSFRFPSAKEVLGCSGPKIWGMSDLAGKRVSLLEALAQVPDHRGRHGRRYELRVILGVAICAVLCGARSLYAISQWGRDHRKRVVEVFGIDRGTTPSVATLHRVFRDLDVSAFERILGQWLCERFERVGEGIAIDGKALRGIHGEEIAGVALVAAYTHRSGIVLAQTRVQGKGNELTGARDLLDYLDVEGHVVTGDALYAQRDLCETIRKRGGTTCSSSKPTSPRCMRP